MYRRILKAGVLACAAAGLWLAVTPETSLAAPGGQGNISGLVTKDDAPLAGATVRLYKNGVVTPVASTTTNSNGEFQFNNVKAGSYVAWATESPTSLTCRGSASVTVVGGQTTNVTIKVICYVLPPHS